jgi:hypothetical protein
VRKDGTIYHYDKGFLHNPDSDSPAIVTANGDKFNFESGKLHSVSGKPAITLADGTEVWAEYGVIHRDVRPAIVRGSDKIWFIHGKVTYIMSDSNTVELSNIIREVSELAGCFGGPIEGRTSRRYDCVYV